MSNQFMDQFISMRIEDYCDAQFWNLPSDWKFRTYASKALNPDHLEPWKINYLRFAFGLTQ